MDAIQRLIDGKIDFQGQRLADRIMQESLVMGAALAFLVGWWLQNLYLCMLMYGFTFLVAVLVTVPPWPFYNKHHVEWLPPTSASTSQGTADKTAAQSSTSTKRTKVSHTSTST